MIQRKLNILSQAGLAKEDFSGATNTEIRVSYCIAGFFEEENFHKFHELVAICKNFTLKMFTLGINKISISKLTNIWKKIIVGNSDAVLPSSSWSLTQITLSSRINAMNDDIKPVVETIMDKGTATRGIYEKFSADGKTRVA